MLVANDFRTELRFTTLLSAPLALGELGWMSTYIVDALMVGRLPNSPLAISASSLGNTIFYAIVFCAIYLLNGLETLIAQAFGRGEEQECAYLLAQSFWIAVISTPIVMLATVGVVALLPRFGTPPEIVVETKHYVNALIWSTGPLMGYMALRRFLQSINAVMLICVSLVTASVVNFVGDWAFLFGHLGVPAMGVAGSGWGTCVVRVYMVLLLMGGTALAFRRNGYRITPAMLVPNRPRLRALLSIGWPSGLQNFEELWTSAYMSVLCARLGTVLLAAHQVVLDLNAFVYQVSAGVSYATIVRVGQSAGRNSRPQVRRAAGASLFLGLGFMLIAATVFAAFARFWAGLYTNSGAVVTAAVPIFSICACGLMGDSLFVILAAAFTGLGDTRRPLYVSLLWNWGIGAPLSYVLAFRCGLGLRGLWIGRCVASLGTGAHLFLLWRLRQRRESRASEPATLNLIPSISASK